MAMKILKIVPDHSYWSLLPTDRGFWNAAYDKHQEIFALELMAPGWTPPGLYVRDPARTQKGSFLNFGSGRLAYSEDVYDSDLGELIERSGEILPAKMEATGEVCHIFNCTACYNCLDRANTKMRMTPDGAMAIQVEKYSFHADRIGDCNLFKIPETRRVELYTLVGRDEPEDDFYSLYQSLGFTGLKFEEVWSDEPPPLP
jgi:hypothetical protein